MNLNNTHLPKISSSSSSACLSVGAEAFSAGVGAGALLVTGAGAGALLVPVAGARAGAGAGAGALLVTEAVECACAVGALVGSGVGVTFCDFGFCSFVTFDSTWLSRGGTAGAEVLVLAGLFVPGDADCGVAVCCHVRLGASF